MHLVGPEAANPELQVGLHVSPLFICEGQSPCAPSSGTLTAHPSLLHCATWDSSPSKHAADWDRKYPLSHVGVQLDPLANCALQFPVSMAFSGRADASHGNSMHTAVLIKGSRRDPPRTSVGAEIKYPSLLHLNEQVSVTFRYAAVVRVVSRPDSALLLSELRVVLS